MGNRSSSRKLYMIFGVMVIALAGVMGAVSASDDGVNNHREEALTGMSEDASSRIDPSLALKMEETQSGTLSIIVLMEEQPKTLFDIQGAKSLAARSQMSLAASLEEIRATNVQSYWLINAISADVHVQKLSEIAARPDVKRIYPDESIKRIETASATSEPGQDGDDMVANPLPDDSGYSSDRIINYTPTSSVDEIGASGYATTRLYLRPDLTGPPYDDFLSEDRETSGWYATEQISVDGDYLTWGNYTLKEDINGTLYGYGIYFASDASTTFEIEIIINGTTVAAFPSLT